MKRIAFLGAKSIGEFCLQVVLDSADRAECELVAFGGNSRLGASDGFQTLLKGREVQSISHPNDLLNLEYDLLISVQYDRILKKEHLDVAEEANINLHMAPLPEYRGCNQFSFAILDQKREFGTSLHLMTPEADAGDLLFERRFEMKEEEWVQELFQKTVEESKVLFEEKWQALLNSEYQAIPQDSLLNERTCSFHLRKEIEAVKELQDSWSLERQKLHFRASYFPPFDPPVLVVEGERKNLDMNWYSSLE